MTVHVPTTPPAPTPAPPPVAPPLTAPPAAHGRAFAYLPGIDGLRALSVVAVILYHADLGILGGGFLGVEVFFVISGYLITSLLLSETDRTGGVSLRHFWLRRARRLLPALYLLLVGVVVASSTIAPDLWHRLRGDVYAAVLYVSNWWQIVHQDSYFVASGRPSLLQHLWSLAVEEQFYLLWPLVFAFGARHLRRPHLALAATAVAFASAAWMALRYDPGGDPTRVYYGTDTRLSGLLLGVALAAMWPAHAFRKERAAPRAGAVLDGAGLAGLAVLVWAVVRVNEFDPFVYRGGFVIVDLATVAVIAVVVHPAARLGRVLGVAPLTWIGLRSYGLYLWHWPVFMLTRPELDVPLTGWPLFAVRMAVVVALTEASYRWVETPIRNGALGRAATRLRRPPVAAAEPATGGRAATTRSAALRPLASPALVVVLAVGLMYVGPLRDEHRDPASMAISSAVEIDDNATTAPPPTAAPTTGVPSTTAPVDSAAAAPAPAPVPPAPAPTAAPPSTSPVPPPLPPVPGGVTALGDSVMIAAADEMRYTLPGVNISARVSRQFPEAIMVLTAMRDQGQIQGTLVVHLGTNGWFTGRQFDQLMAVAGDRRVLFLTARAPRSWEAISNQRLREGVDRWPNAQLADWRATSEGHPEYFTDDGIHLTPAGQRAYAGFIRQTLG